MFRWQPIHHWQLESAQNLSFLSRLNSGSDFFNKTTILMLDMFPCIKFVLSVSLSQWHCSLAVFSKSQHTYRKGSNYIYTTYNCPTTYQTDIWAICDWPMTCVTDLWTGRGRLRRHSGGDSGRRRRWRSRAPAWGEVQGQCGCPRPRTGRTHAATGTDDWNKTYIPTSCRHGMSMAPSNIYGGKAISNKYVFRFFTKGGFRRFNCN